MQVLPHCSPHVRVTEVSTAGFALSKSNEFTAGALQTVPQDSAQPTPLQLTPHSVPRHALAQNTLEQSFSHWEPQHTTKSGVPSTQPILPPNQEDMERTR
eukprot:m.430423 g.430423  ORF g.430423 m.430423 type:complete len:100 (-) comp79570_c0_seq1:294-593(-)